ncbi:MAG: cell division protein ZapA [Bacteriovoracaceae bacterium]|nr:cell division protein ZapA [Bacteriovoracaceae bacterium]
MTNKDKAEEYREFEILGHKVRFRPENGSLVTAENVIKLIQNEVCEVDKKISSARASDKFLLVALKLANERLAMEQELKQSIDKLEIRLNETQIIIDSCISYPEA